MLRHSAAKEVSGDGCRTLGDTVRLGIRDPRRPVSGAAAGGCHRGAHISDFFQIFHSEQAASKLQNLVTLTASVWRDAQLSDIPMRDVCPAMSSSCERATWCPAMQR